MSQKKEINPVFVENINYLINNCFDSIIEFSNKIDVDDTTIRNYRDGKRAPSDDVLARISNYFRLPKEALTTINIESFFKLNFSQDNHIDFFDCFPMPDISSDIRNKYKNSIKKVSEYITLLDKQYIFKPSLMTDAKNNLNENKRKNKEVRLLYIWCYLIDEYIQLFNFEESDSPQMIKEKLFVDINSNSDKCIFIDNKNIDELFHDCKTVLNNGWDELIYYYLTIRYINGYGARGLSIQENKKIGFEMMSFLHSLGNVYAKQLFSMTDNITNKVLDN